MKRYSYGVYALLTYISFVMVSCNSGRKFNYASAYKFNVPASYSYGKALTPASPMVVQENTNDSVAGEPEQMLVSTERNIVLPRRIVKPVNLEKTAEKTVSANVVKELSTLTVKEIRKEIRVGFKKYHQEIKDRKKVSEVEKTQDSSFAKGVVLVILGVIIIVAGILLVNGLGVLVGSLIAALGLIVFLIGLLKLIL
jgi:hypothetical protein